MKEKKNKGARKVLLMAISVALVAAVSVSVTLAYLTATTGEKDNQFKASGSINGKVIEPAYDQEKADSYLPGVPVAKNPMIDNDSANDYEIYVGARLDFYIDLNNNGSYEQVSYADFINFVDITTLPTATSIPASEDGKWYDITPSTETNSKYYLYNKVLAKNDGDSGANANAGNDTTTAIFDSVTVKKELNLSASGVAITQEDVTAGTLSKTYNGFRYKITVTGYGVKNEVDVTASSAKDIILAGLQP